ncbi:hypothetical protein OUZ56_032095 [Daphnia magna]|uniref:Uncharacterized protein n=1 Tax=Daphnia magna TaxID=35525 RepID=A0ABQ9ZW53_9CRUS|nr:hypothetical protein OUZ56_032095 [Daphnia magna]
MICPIFGDSVEQRIYLLVTDVSNDSAEQLVPLPKDYVPITMVRPYPKTTMTAKVRVTKTRLGKSRVLTDTPGKEDIEREISL